MKFPFKLALAAGVVLAALVTVLLTAPPPARAQGYTPDIEAARGGHTYQVGQRGTRAKLVIETPLTYNAASLTTQTYAIDYLLPGDLVFLTAAQTAVTTAVTVRQALVSTNSLALTLLYDPGTTVTLGARFVRLE